MWLEEDGCMVYPCMLAGMCDDDDGAGGGRDGRDVDDGASGTDVGMSSKYMLSSPMLARGVWRGVSCGVARPLSDPLLDGACGFF
jgi:hypothetical protein